ncbi:MAG: hypothetical protein ACRDL5_03355 [Solirubrobacteraceae bacterium]
MTATALGALRLAAVGVQRQPTRRRVWAWGWVTSTTVMSCSRRCRTSAAA